MMEKIFISVEKSSRMVSLTKKYIGNDLENLQQELVFKFTDSFVEGESRLEYQIGGNKYHIPMTRDGESYTVPIKNVLTKEGKIPMQLVVVQVEQNEEIPVFKSNVFEMYCNKSINAQTEAPDDYEYWLDVIQTKLAEIDEALEEVDNLNIEATRVSDGVEISITDKEGETTTEKVNDGEPGPQGPKGDDYVITPADYNAIANIVKEEIVIPTKTSDLTNDSGFITNVVNNLTNYYLKSQTYTKDEVNNLISQISTLRIVKVEELPIVGQSGIIYLVPTEDPEQKNIFEEYIWIDNDFELIGSTKIDLTGYATETWVNTQIADFLTQSEITNLINTALNNYYTKGQIDSALSNKVDNSVLTDYVKNTDYATSEKAGVIKTISYYGVATGSTGNIYPTTLTNTEYNNSQDYTFIGKGTLENVITGKGLTNVAHTNSNNNFSSAQTINGTLTVNGDISQTGSSYETHAEQVFTKNDYIVTRDGATGGLGNNEYTGFEAEKYDGTNNGRLVFDNTGTARVGDVGDEVPLLARDESSNMSDGYVMTWDGTDLVAKTSFAIVTLTQAQYDALQTYDSNTYYMIVEE